VVKIERTSYQILYALNLHRKVGTLAEKICRRARVVRGSQKSLTRLESQSTLPGLWRNQNKIKCRRPSGPGFSSFAPGRTCILFCRVSLIAER
jgi:hypothetical protein